jgi:putative transposase
MQAKIDPKQNLSNFPKSQYLVQPQSLQYDEQQSINRDECIAQAYNSGGFSMAETGNYFALHYSRVSRIVKNRRLE